VGTEAADLKDRRARRAVLIAAIVGSSMTFVDGTVVNVALPVLRQRLGADLGQAQWIVESYMLFLSSLMLAGGALGDRLGRRFVFAAGVVLFGLASMWCGIASGVQQLIVARGVQGVGAALLVPGSLALISANFSKDSRGRAIGTWAACTSMAAGIGPVIGGWLVEHVSWRWIFFLNVPPALGVLAYLRHVPESRGTAAATRIDWAGAALATAGLFALVYGLIGGGSRGFAAFDVQAGLLLGALALAGFVAVEMRVHDPMMPLELFRSRTFAGANLLTLFLYSGLSAIMFVLPFNLITVQKYSTVEAAAAFVPFVLVMFTLSRWSGGLMDRLGPRVPLIVGPMVAAAGFFLFTRLAGGGPYWSTVLPAVLGMSLGMAITVAPLTTAVMTSVDEGRAGVASGVNNAVSRIASLIAVAVAGTIVGGSFETGLVRVAWTSVGLALAASAGAALLIDKKRDVSPTR
jgi:EmrB/QacA subfamily drug resistance transporter